MQHFSCSKSCLQKLFCLINLWLKHTWSAHSFNWGKFVNEEHLFCSTIVGFEQEVFLNLADSFTQHKFKQKNKVYIAHPGLHYSYNLNFIYMTICTMKTKYKRIIVLIHTLWPLLVIALYEYFQLLVICSSNAFLRSVINFWQTFMNGN